MRIYRIGLRTLLAKITELGPVPVPTDPLVIRLGTLVFLIAPGAQALARWTVPSAKKMREKQSRRIFLTEKVFARGRT
jgi:hypothetical protein